MFTITRTNEEVMQDSSNRIWLDGFYSEGDIEGKDDLGNFEYSLDSLVFGGDFSISEEGQLGAFLAVGTHDMDEHDKAQQELSAQKLHLGLYINQEGIGIWDVRAAFGIAYGDHDSERTFQFGTSTNDADASFKSLDAYTGIQGSFTWISNDVVKLAPELELNYTYYTQDKIKETGADGFNLDVKEADSSALITRASLNALFFPTGPVQALAKLGYGYDWMASDDDVHEVEAKYSASQDGYETFVGQNRGSNILTAGLGVGGGIAQSWYLSGGLLYTYHDHGDEVSIGANAQWQF